MLGQASAPEFDKKIRIGSLNPKKIKRREFLPFSTDGERAYDGRRTLPVREFLIENSGTDSILIVLTSKEYRLLYPMLPDYDVTVQVFELTFPIFDKIKFIPDYVKTYRYLLSLLERVENLGIRANTLSRHFSVKSQYRVERKLRFKSRLDRFFYFSDPASYQEVFKLKETRDDRCVIAFDFNSMFLDCMRGRFSSPKNLSYKKINEYWVGGTIEPGIYHVILEGVKNELFRHYHPFRVTFQGHSFRFEAHRGSSIEALLFHDEVSEYAQYFDSTFLMAGISSDTEINHPLIKSAESLYKHRLNFRAQNSKELERLTKFELQLMHSSTSIKRSREIKLSSLTKLLSWLEDTYWMRFSSDPNRNIGRLKELHRGIELKIRKEDDGILVKSLDLDSPYNVFSLSRNVVAKSRVKMFQTILRFSQHPSLEICYANVDSLHVSIKKSELDSFMSSIGDLIGERAGKLKVEAVADHGYWFDVGRYWLVTDGSVIAFKNSTLHHKGSSSEFTRSRRISKLFKSGFVSHVKDFYISIDNLFSYKKKVQKRDDDNIEFVRYKLSELSDFDLSRRSVSDEILRSKKIKRDIFDNISRNYT